MVNSTKDKAFPLKIQSCFTGFDTSESRMYSFMNPASLTAFFSSQGDSEINYFCDSKLMSILVSLVSGRKVQRVSFDYTSIADFVFEHSISGNKKIYFIGAKTEEINAFIQKIRIKHTGIIICGYRDGYFCNSEISEVYRQIILTGPDIVVAGLGAGMQETFIKGLKNAGCNSVFFTCGGFIRQESTSENDYYPAFVNKLGLRGFYRMFKEPHTIKRYFINYPLNIVKFVSYCRSKKIDLNVN